MFSSFSLTFFLSARPPWQRVLSFPRGHFPSVPVFRSTLRWSFQLPSDVVDYVLLANDIVVHIRAKQVVSRVMRNNDCSLVE